MSPSERPVLVIVGRPNVGKSTLFNRVTRSRRAITGNEPGITRDRILMEAEWRGRRFLATDTGGMSFGTDEEFPLLTNEEVRRAIEAASHIIFLVDGRSPLTVDDRELADLLRRSGKPVTVAVNKCDTDALDRQAVEFYELGFGEPAPISAEHDRGVRELLDRATAEFPVSPDDEAEEDRKSLIRVAIIGRPNVGKSTLLNRLVGEERAIVSPTPGATRDAVDAEIRRGPTLFRFIDTAGIRRKGKTRQMAEKLSMVMAQRHLRMADVALTLLDAAEGVTALDANIAGYAHQDGKAVILVVNKWDLVSERGRGKFRRQVHDGLKFLDYAPVALISALEDKGVDSLLPVIRKAFRESRKRIPTAELNRFLATVDLDRASSPGFRRHKIHYVTQARTAPPTFVFFTNRDEGFHFSFERFLINQLRREFGFEGSPIVVKAKRKRR